MSHPRPRPAAEGSTFDDALEIAAPLLEQLEAVEAIRTILVERGRRGAATRAVRQAAGTPETPVGRRATPGTGVTQCVPVGEPAPNHTAVAAPNDDAHLPGELSDAEDRPPLVLVSRRRRGRRPEAQPTRPRQARYRRTHPERATLDLRRLRSGSGTTPRTGAEP